MWAKIKITFPMYSKTNNCTLEWKGQCNINISTGSIGNVVESIERKIQREIRVYEREFYFSGYLVVVSFTGVNHVHYLFEREDWTIGALTEIIRIGIFGYVAST